MAEEFDSYAGRYQELLEDPIRQGFAPGGAEFFALRKWALIREFFERRGESMASRRWLDVGCGQGELLGMGRSSFRQVAGCDLSREMLAGVCDGVETTLQTCPDRLPYADAGFDFVTAVCVFHHVELSARLPLAREMSRVLAPGGVAAIIEHNPLHPATRLIVSRTPVDRNAILMRAKEAEWLLRETGLDVLDTQYFLYLPEAMYGLAPGLESALRRAPFGGQYATFGRKEDNA